MKRLVRVGVRLRAIRKDLDYGQAKLAQALGCSQSFIAEMEADRSGPSAKVVVALDRLGYSSAWLLTGSGSMKSIPSTRPCSSLFLNPAPICRFDLAWCRDHHCPIQRRRRLIRIAALAFGFCLLAFALSAIPRSSSSF